MAYTWTNDWATGHDVIDTQHKQLFKAINDLLDACSSGQGRTQIDKTVAFLADYTKKHFGEEEQLQQKFQYPDYPNHKKLHEGFKAKVTEIGQQLHKEGASIGLVAQVNSHIGGWLVTHIQREDKKVAAHIASKS